MALLWRGLRAHLALPKTRSLQLRYFAAPDVAKSFTDVETSRRFRFKSPDIQARGASPKQRPIPKTARQVDEDMDREWQEFEKSHQDFDTQERYHLYSFTLRAQWWQQNMVSGTMPQTLRDSAYLTPEFNEVRTHQPEMIGRYFEVPKEFVERYWSLDPLDPAEREKKKQQDREAEKKREINPDDPYDDVSFRHVLRPLGDKLVPGEFMTTGTTRFMVREESLALARCLQAFQQAAFPSLSSSSSSSTSTSETSSETSSETTSPDSSSSESASPSSSSSAEILVATNPTDHSSLILQYEDDDTERFMASRKTGDARLGVKKRLLPDWLVAPGALQRPEVQALLANGQDVRGRAFHVNGVAGCGRSTSLNYAALYARQNNWFVVHIPRFEIFCSYHYLLVPSESHPGKFDQPELAMFFFRDLLELDAEKLKQIKLKGDYRNPPVDTVNFNERHINLCAEDKRGYPFFQDDGTGSLYDLVKYGADNRIYAVRTVEHFLKELDAVTEFPVLLAMDGINAYHCATGYNHPDTFKPLTAEQLTFPSLLSKFFTKGPSNGVSVCAFTSKVPNKVPMTPSSVISFEPRPYTSSELTFAIFHYALADVFSNQIIDAQLVGHTSMMTNRVPAQVLHYLYYITE
eukprot:TRINITY_DN2045_c0_g1_i1.p1 TRINITY_DN2045_c0_g1~~TRINITY_DN2045_c0_g1_i1.p1  ORF type:complete len:634 (-),score=192.09 TRINITY_DN2045_c0_g1_i1:35-1936(-)